MNTTPKTNDNGLNGKSTMNEDVFPIEDGGFSNVMLVFRGLDTKNDAIFEAGFSHFPRPITLGVN